VGFWEYLQELFGQRLGAKAVSVAPNLAEAPVQFGDRVRILADSSTEARGLVGKVGTVYGQTTPSSTHPNVIGTLFKDYAVSVFLDDLDEQCWFAEQLLELVDHGAGATVRLDGVNKEWVKRPNGSWDERPIR
jgi:hypothetical protein